MNDGKQENVPAVVILCFKISSRFTSVQHPPLHQHMNLLGPKHMGMIDVRGNHQIGAIETWVQNHIIAIPEEANVQLNFYLLIFRS